MIARRRFWSRERDRARGRFRVFGEKGKMGERERESALGFCFFFFSCIVCLFIFLYLMKGNKRVPIQQTDFFLVLFIYFVIHPPFSYIILLIKCQRRELL